MISALSFSLSLMLIFSTTVSQTTVVYSCNHSFSVASIILFYSTTIQCHYLRSSYDGMFHLCSAFFAAFPSSLVWPPHPFELGKCIVRCSYADLQLLSLPKEGDATILRCSSSHRERATSEPKSRKNILETDRRAIDLTRRTSNLHIPPPVSGV